MTDAPPATEAELDEEHRCALYSARLAQYQRKRYPRLKLSKHQRACCKRLVAWGFMAVSRKGSANRRTEYRARNAAAKRIGDIEAKLAADLARIEAGNV